MKSLPNKLLTIFFIYSSLFVSAQSDQCEYWPAPCANSTAISHADDWAERMKDNIALQQGLAFQKKLRNQLTDLLQQTARQNGWQVYELTEEANDGPPFIFISYAGWEATPYEKRPPVSDDIAFVMIVNKDSLNAWRKLREKFQSEAENETNTYAADMKKAGDDPMLKVYFDSANYYMQERLNYDYDQAHQQQYLQDIKANNKQGLKEHEKMEKSFADKYNWYIKKYQDEQTKAYSGANKTMNAMQDNEAQHTVAFTEGSVVLIHFGINPYLTGTGLESGDQHSLIPQYPLKITGASYAGLLVNKTAPDRHAYDFNYKGYYFNSPASIATILFGSYQPKDTYNNYRPVFEKGFTTAANTPSSKNIKCDVLQNLSVHIEGRADKVNSIIKNINWAAISSMIGK